MARVHSSASGSAKPAPSIGRSVLTGGIGFSAVSLAVFATVAFAERWMYSHLTVTGAYLVWTFAFILLGGALFGSLVVGRWRLPKFYLLYGVAFFAYAAGWVGAYFTSGGRKGEWLGSLAGTILMAFVLAFGFNALRSTLKFSALLFASNSIGYFLGSSLNDYVGAESGMLLWGLVYGLFFGSGIGAVIQMSQSTESRSFADLK